MKTIQIAKDNWWDSLSREEQLEYVKMHPDSNYADKIRSQDTRTVNRLKTNPAITRSPEDTKVFELAKADGISIPPAWSKVSYHGKEGNEKGVVAEGTDGKGRKQRLENSTYREEMIKLKHNKIRENLSPKMPKIISALKKSVSKGESEEAKVLYLITQSAFRIGGKGDGKSDQAFGASTLKGKHVKVKGNVVTFNFVGKGGVEQNHTINDKLIADMVKDKEPEDNLFNTNENKVRDLWKKYGGDKVHDIRSHIATEEAIKVMHEFGEVTNAKEFKALLKAASEASAKKLGNKPAESLKTYIDNSIFDGIHIQ